MLNFSSSHVKSIGAQRKTFLVMCVFDLLGHTQETKTALPEVTATDDVQ